MSIHGETGAYIVDRRKQMGFTQEKLALECEMSPSYLRRIEHGTANPTVNEFQRIADVLDLELQIPFVVPNRTIVAE